MPCKWLAAVHTAPMRVLHTYTLPITGLLGFCAIAMGAVGAHAISDASAQLFIERASFYQLTHAVALLALRTAAGRAAHVARLCFVLGVLLFCGSLYAKGFALVSHAPLAPMGGTLLMLGWLALVFGRKEAAL